MCRYIVLVVLIAVVCGCSDGTTSPSLPAPTTTLTFSGLSTNGASVPLYTEGSFAVSATPGDWVAVTTYGHPQPFIEFVTKGTETGEVHISADGHAPFRFLSVDLYSSTTPIPYTISGVRDFSTVYTISDTLPNTFGNFRTVVNPRATDVIDTLTISLTNAAATCCPNPMGLDNVVLTR